MGNREQASHSVLWRRGGNHVGNRNPIQGVQRGRGKGGGVKQKE